MLDDFLIFNLFFFTENSFLIYYINQQTRAKRGAALQPPSGLIKQFIRSPIATFVQKLWRFCRTGKIPCTGKTYISVLEIIEPACCVKVWSQQREGPRSTGFPRLVFMILKGWIPSILYCIIYCVLGNNYGKNCLFNFKFLKLLKLLGINYLRIREFNVINSTCDMLTTAPLTH